MAVHIPAETVPTTWPLILRPTEVAYCLYMPVSIPGSPNIQLNHVERPDLAFALPMLHKIRDIEKELFTDRYAYLTVKRMFVSPQVTANRPGWHSDGFGTTDINYIWYDCLPTILSAGEFNVDEDHNISLVQFAEQAERQMSYQVNVDTLIRLTPEHIHRVQLADKQMMRTFVKVSLSENQFNLSDNSTNPAIKAWKTYPREIVRNSPHAAQKDFHNPIDPHLQ